jgi:tetratricopeptide (TPR) repeat protein
MLCEDLGLLNRAIQDYRKALELDPANEKAYESYCEALEKWGGNEAAEEPPHLENKLRPSLKAATYKRGMTDQLLGWPGHRTRHRRSGLDPVETSNEISHLEGIYIRRLFTGEAFRKRDAWQSLKYSWVSADW